MNYSSDYFRVKISLKLLVKSLLHSVFSLITWITKLSIKRPIERLQQSSPTMDALVENLSKCYDYFLRLSGFSDVYGKVFWSLLNSPNLITHHVSQRHCK